MLTTLGLTLSGSSSASVADPVPHCVVGTFTENSGNGPTYHNVKYCNLTNNTNNLIVDGSPLQNKAVIFGQTVAALTAQTMTKTQVNSLPSLAGCFGHHGVQLSTHIAYECIDQSVSGGALYWSANESNFNWDKHPDNGLLWVEASTLHPTSDANPPNNKQAFWVGIGHQGAFCTVINPGYNQHPTQCEVNGAVHTMTKVQQASYNAFAAAMQSANLPDCAWSMTIVSDQCDVDS